jgi:hypothetical protein
MYELKIPLKKSTSLNLVEEKTGKLKRKPSGGEHAQGGCS